MFIKLQTVSFVPQVDVSKKDTTALIFFIVQRKNRNVHLFQFCVTYLPIQSPLFFTQVASINSHIK